MSTYQPPKKHWKQWSEGEKQVYYTEIIRLWRETLTFSTIADRLGAGVPRIKKVLEAAGIDWRAGLAQRVTGVVDRSGVVATAPARETLVATAEPLPAPTPVDPVEAERERIERMRTLGHERTLVKAIAGEKSLRAFLEQLFLDVAPTFEPAPPMPPPRIAKNASTETALLCFSDWHAYEEVKAERVLGLNHYDAETLGRRVRRVVESAISIKTRMERGGGWHFPNLVVACNGDFVSGTIHELERHSDAPNVVMAVYACGMMLATALRDLAPHFKKVDVYCTSGNHGRMPDARRMQQKDPLRNWDSVIYLFARTALRDVTNIRFVIPDSYSVMFDVGPWRFLQTHGHEIKSWNSVPYYGVDRFERNINSLMATRLSPVHYVLISHFHSFASLPASIGEKFVNGSLIGGNEFSVNGLGKADNPTQLFMAVHPEHGVTSRWPILADGEVEQGYPCRAWEGLG